MVYYGIFASLGLPGAIPPTLVPEAGAVRLILPTDHARFLFQTYRINHSGFKLNLAGVLPNPLGTAELIRAFPASFAGFFVIKFSSAKSRITRFLCLSVTCAL